MLGELESADAALAGARTLLEHFTAARPVVVVLDDLHWAVPTFLDLVEYVVRAVDGPLLVVSITRPELLERRPAWGDGATLLDALAGDDARELLDALPEREALDERLATAILDAAEGVPLFLEQLAAHAAELGLADDASRGRSTRCSQAASMRSSPASAPCCRGRRSSAERSRASRSAR